MLFFFRKLHFKLLLILRGGKVEESKDESVFSKDIIIIELEPCDTKPEIRLLKYFHLLNESE